MKAYLSVLAAVLFSTVVLYPGGHTGSPLKSINPLSVAVVGRQQRDFSRDIFAREIGAIM